MPVMQRTRKAPCEHQCDHVNVHVTVHECRCACELRPVRAFVHACVCKGVFRLSLKDTNVHKVKIQASFC